MMTGDIECIRDDQHFTPASDRDAWIKAARTEHQPDEARATGGDWADPNQADAVMREVDGEMPSTGVTAVADVQVSNGAHFPATVGTAPDVTDVTRGGSVSIPDADHRPAFKVFEDWIELPDGRKLRPGVWYFGIKAGKKPRSPPR